MKFPLSFVTEVSFDGQFYLLFIGLWQGRPARKVPVDETQFRKSSCLIIVNMTARKQSRKKEK